MKRKEKASFVSLGCFRNRYDSEVLAAGIISSEKDLLPVDSISSRNKCGILAVNTCGFITPAKIESLEAINEAISLKKEGKVKKIYVFGCLVQRYKKQLQINFPEVDRWQGVVSFSKTYQRRLRQKGPVDFLKICEGCINHCSYCAIPLIKGPLQSRPASEILKEVKRLDSAGVKELNIIGQDITSWAKDLKGERDLTYLIKKILKAAKKIKWLRLTYTHPKHFSDELISLIAQEERICKYVDLPIQHINKRILKMMKRKVSPQQIISLIEKIRKKIPGCAIRTAVITGFPSEGEAEFEELLKFIKEVKFEKLGVFVYSREENTEAGKLSGQVHPMTKKRRRRQIMEAQQRISTQSLKSFIGEKIEVLVTDKKDGYYIGRSQYDAPEVDGLVFLHRKNLKVGQFYNVQVTDSLEYDLVAQ